ncbi:hypothetical protein D9M71_492850 [compost metagenome]
MGWHLEGAQLKQAQAATGTVGRVQLVDAKLGTVGVAGHIDQQIAQQAVDQPWRARLTRPRHLSKGYFQLVQGVVTCLVDPWRLRSRADEQAGKQVRQRRMVMPITDQAAQQVRPPQKRRIGRRRATEHQMVTATRARVAPVDHELLGTQARLPGLLIEELGAFDQFIPTGRGLHIDFDDTRVGGHLEVAQAGVAWRLIALEQDRAI